MFFTVNNDVPHVSISTTHNVPTRPSLYHTRRRVVPNDRILEGGGIDALFDPIHIAIRMANSPHIYGRASVLAAQRLLAPRLERTEAHYYADIDEVSEEEEDIYEPPTAPPTLRRRNAFIV